MNLKERKTHSMVRQTVPLAAGWRIAACDDDDDLELITEYPIAALAYIDKWFCDDEGGLCPGLRECHRQAEDKEDMNQSWYPIWVTGDGGFNHEDYDERFSFTFTKVILGPNEALTTERKWSLYKQRLQAEEWERKRLEKGKSA